MYVDRWRGQQQILKHPVQCSDTYVKGMNKSEIMKKRNRRGTTSRLSKSRDKSRQYKKNLRN